MNSLVKSFIGINELIRKTQEKKPKDLVLTIAFLSIS